MTSVSTVSPRYSAGYQRANTRSARGSQARKPEVVSVSGAGQPGQHRRTASASPTPRAAYGVVALPANRAPITRSCVVEQRRAASGHSAGRAGRRRRPGGDVVAVVAGVAVAGAHRPADAEVVRQLRHTGAGGAATAAVRSVEPSSTTSTSTPGSSPRTSPTTSAIDPASLKAGTMIRTRLPLTIGDTSSSGRRGAGRLRGGGRCSLRGAGRSPRPGSGSPPPGG